MAERRVSGFKSELGRDSSSRARVGRLLGPIKTQAITIASLLRWAIRHVFSGLCHVASLVPGGAAVPAGAREFPDIDALCGLESAAERDAEIDKYVSVVIAGAYVVLKGTQAQVDAWEAKCAESPQFERKIVRSTVGQGGYERRRFAVGPPGSAHGATNGAAEAVKIWLARYS